MASLQQLRTAWKKANGPREALDEFYEEVLEDDIVLQDDIPDVTKAAAQDLSNTLNNLKIIFETSRSQTPNNDYYSLSGEVSGIGAFAGEYVWPEDICEEGRPECTSGLYESAALLFKEIVETLKVLQENPLLTQTNLYDDLFVFGSGVTEDLPSLIDQVLDSAPDFIELFPQITLSLKSDVPPVAPTAGLGPAAIFSDTNLEASLTFQSSQTHYVGFLLDSDKSDGERSRSYLPVRLAPNTSEESLSLGWSDPNYSLINNNGNLVKPANKDSDGVEIPLGLEIKIVEIVPSKTGMWVGFVSTDSRLADDQVPAGPNGQYTSRWDAFITNGQRRLLYTKAQYVRIKEAAISSNPDPYLSERAAIGDDQAAEARGLKGTGAVNPKENQNWITIKPNDVRLNYYSFNEHNLQVIAQGDESSLLYNQNTIADFPTLKYSEGYFYFILGEKPRKTEAELINESDVDLESSSSELEKAKASAGQESAISIKEEAWSNLLNYLGKNTEGGNSNLYNKLYQEYFIEVSKKLNTKATNPNNQKILYAIRASYIDSLPEVRRPYINNFEPGSPYLTGNSYAVSLPMRDVKKRADYLINNVLTPVKSNIENSKKRLENANGLLYDIQQQIKAMKDLPVVLDKFLKRQSFPSSMNKSFIHDMILEGTKTDDEEHLIQIGIKDNGEVGGDVRETVSYVLFSPNPDKLKNKEKDDSDLFYVDPYLTDEELSKTTSVNRSAIPLQIALPWLRAELEGATGARTLHLFLSHDKIKRKLLKSQTDLQKDWPELLSNFLVPPVRIYHSRDPSLVEEEELDCDEIIKRLNKSGPNTTIEERRLQNKLYSTPGCAEIYFNQFKEDTPAVSPGMSKEELERKAEEAEQGASILDNQYVKILYTGFFNSLDLRSMTALIMACLEKKLGIALTAEAICEAAIIKLIEDSGTDSVEKVMLANALLSADSESSKKFLEEYYKAPPFAPKDTEKDVSVVDIDKENAFTFFRELDESYNNAPLATSMLMSKRAPGAVAEVIKNLEKGGVYVELIPGKRPTTSDQITVPYGGAFFDSELIISETYSQFEIENEKKRLMDVGYSQEDARAIMVGSGYLVANPQQYQSILDGEDFSTPTGKFAKSTRSGLLSGAVKFSGTEDLRAVSQDAENWLQYMKGVIGLQSICELIVGQVLDGLQDLIKDPGAFFSGGGKGWWEDFVDSLKRQFSPPLPTLRFPDSLSTDNHMGDYAQKLYKTLISMVAQMLGQIVRLILKSALEQCLEEDSDIGVSGRPPSLPPDIPFPTLERANLPRFDNVPAPDVVAWMKDLLDNVTTAQLCALLRGDATKQTLTNCLIRTREYWPAVYSNGVDTIYEIRVAFEKIGAELDLDICNVVQSPTLVNNLCEAVYDRDARCQELKRKGLTEAECQEQIDRELEDLKSKAAGLTTLSLLDINPLSNSFPPICGDGGSFVMPSGVRDTMERITDNMLTNLKGSLLLDMNGLKFFSTPPRALLALSDPKELKNAHKMFIDMVKKPYSKNCLALIGDPYNHAKVFSEEKKMNIGLHTLYPITYNKYIHYGNFSTWTARKESIDLEISHVKYSSLGSVAESADFQRSEPDLAKDIEDYLLDTNLRNSPNFFDSEELMPLNIGLNTNLSDDPGKIQDFVAEKTAINLVGEIEEEFKKEIKPLNLHLLRVDPEKIPTYEAEDDQFPSNRTITRTSFSKDYTNVLKRTYSLDTKLKDISRDPISWYLMLRNYTGVDLQPIRGDRRVFPKEWLRGDLAQQFLNIFPVNLEEARGVSTTTTSTGTQYGNEVVTVAGQKVVEGAGTFYFDEDISSYGQDKWYNWLKISPGLRNLLPIMIEREQSGLGSQTSFRPFSIASPREHNVAFAFMELTLGEATGLSYERIQKIFPNMFDSFSLAPGIILGIDQDVKTAVIPAIYALGAGDTDNFDIVQETVPQQSTYSTGTDQAEGFYPFYLVFEKFFRDPDSPLNTSDPDVFSLNKEKVNQELYDFFDSIIPDSFLNILPATGVVIGGIEILDPSQNKAERMYIDAIGLEYQKNFNQNILRYDLPFTEIAAKSQSGLDGAAKTQEILDIFTTSDASSQLDLLADTLDAVNFNRVIINQNVATPLETNIQVQTENIKDISKLLKSSLVSSAPNMPNVIDSDSKLTSEIYNFNYTKDLHPSVRSILQTIYSSEANVSKVFDSYQQTWLSAAQPQALEPLNLKSQIFADFLSKKFFDAFDEYPNSADEQSKSIFKKKLKQKLSTYGYSALQYAYSTEMFAKLRSSRLNERGFMKKLWKKILKSPMVSDSIDPRCAQIFENISAPARGDLDQTETDFFNLSEIKPKIIEFYEKSLCRDVYESNSQGENATRTSLLEGMVKLIIKVYTLEMCLASVIAWDSFDMSEPMKDSSFVSIIVKNISDDFDLDFISFFATDILRKEENLTDMQLARLRQGDKGIKQSSVEYLINQEADSISGIIKSMFTNSSPFSTDLQVELIKNSDSDFDQRYKTEIAPEDDAHYKLSSLYTEAGYEYVLDARIKNNIYTMNYGAGTKEEFINAKSQINDQDHPAKSSTDIFGLSSAQKNNKNYFHSLPMNYHHLAEGNNLGGFNDSSVSSYGSPPDDDLYARWKDIAWKVDGDETTGTAGVFNIINNLQKTILNSSDAFSFENNPETTHGNNLNAKLGNIIFQPYIRVEDYGPNDERDFFAQVYSETESTGEPCEGATLEASYNMVDFATAFDNFMNSFRTAKNNIFNCHMYDYIPLSVWSFFYNNIFMKEIQKYPGLQAIYNKFGLEPFFKKVSFGMRMTYVTAAPKIVEDTDLGSFMKSDASLIGGYQSLTLGKDSSLKDVKSFYNYRPYYIAGDSDTSDPKLLRELQIPIVEIEKEIRTIENTGQFTVGESDVFPLSLLGTWNSGTENLSAGATLKELLENKEAVEPLVNNMHQFFYNNLANTMLGEVKQTAEFKLMFDYLFPMRRYMALATMVAADGLSRFIPEPTDVLQETKSSMQVIIDTIVSSTDYKNVPDPIANMLANSMMRSEAGTSGKEPDMTKEILRIVLTTPLLVLKGFVEVTDPAVITAKKIIDIANAIQLATITAIKQGVRAALQVIQAGIDAANQIIQQVEIQLSVGVGFAQAAIATLPKVIVPGSPASTELVPAQPALEAGGVIKNETGGPLNIEISKDGEPHVIHIPIGEKYILQSGESRGGTPETEKTIPAVPGGEIDLASLVNIDASDADIRNWVFEIEDPPSFGGDEEAEKQWKSFKTEFLRLKGLRDDYITAKDKVDPEKPGNLIKKRDDLKKESDVIIRKAENTMKDVFTSPYLLPGMWAALFPSIIPYGGGIHPYPMPPPSISTVPGMIYLALLFIDAIEEKMHDDQQKLGDPKCEDQL